MTTLPSGSHLGHFKAPVQCHSLDLNTEMGQELTDKQTHLIDTHIRWKILVNMVIAKDPSMRLKSHCTKKGMDKSVTLVYAKTLQKAQYQLKTAFGASNDYYSHCKIYPIYGSGQGAINLPGIWLATSSTIGDIYEGLAHGAKFVSPDQAISVLLTLLGFVDDVTNQVNIFKDCNITVSQLL
eukprot:5059384-Ditylum_brightwellii.AAC.2